MIVYLSESIGSILPLLSLLCLYVLFLSLLILLDDGLVSECAIQVFLRLLVPLPFLPGHVDKLLLVRKHVFRVILLDFEEHFVLVHAMEGTKHQPLLVSIHEYVHAQLDCLAARFACIAVEGHLLQLSFIPDLLSFEFFVVLEHFEVNLVNLIL